MVSFLSFIIHFTFCFFLFNFFLPLFLSQSWTRVSQLPVPALSVCHVLELYHCYHFISFVLSLCLFLCLHFQLLFLSSDSSLFSSSFSYITNWVSLSMRLLLIQYHTSPLSLNYWQLWAIWVARSGCQKLESKLSNLRVMGPIFIHILLPFSCRSPCVLKFCVVILQIFLLSSHLAHSRADPWKKMSNEILVRFKVWN